MPKISEWGSVAIYINTRGEHNPPHFHAVCGEWEAAVRINDFALMAGKLPPRIFGQVIEWAALHQGELIQEWDNMRSGRQLNRINPLQ